jgi:anti-sigma regulatory factor (Ser/Thr protein kinase)
MADMTYDEKETVLDPGEGLLLHSDGIAEAHDPGRAMFGFPRMRDLVARVEAGQPLIDELLNDLGRFTGAAWEQEDDITLVTLVRSAGVPETRVLDEFEVPSVSGNERQAMERVATSMREVDLSGRRLERLKTAVAEATMNAIEHGNGNRPEIPVEVEVTQDGDEIVVAITDQGGRMHPDTDEHEAPDLVRKLDGDQSPRGWGLFLIRNMVDAMDVTTDGRRHTIWLTMRTGGAAHDERM